MADERDVVCVQRTDGSLSGFTFTAADAETFLAGPNGAEYAVVDCPKIVPDDPSQPVDPGDITPEPETDPDAPAAKSTKKSAS